MGLIAALVAIGTAFGNANGAFSGHPHIHRWFYGAAAALAIVAALLSFRKSVDKALAKHLRSLLNEVSENAKKLLRIAALYDSFDLRDIRVDGLSSDEIWEAGKECRSVGLLTMEWEDVDTSSPLAMANMRQFSRVPAEFRETLRLLLKA